MQSSAGNVERRFRGEYWKLAYKVEYVWPDGTRKLCGGVKSYRLKRTAESAKKHYERFIKDKPKWENVKVELTEV